MCQGLEVEGLRYETGVIRVWFGYDSRSTIQHTVSDLDRSYNGQSAPEAGRCKRYRLPQWSYSGQCRDPWSPNNNHQQAFKNDLHFGGLLRGMLRGYASGCASGVCFARAPPSTNTYLGPRKKILTHLSICKLENEAILPDFLNLTTSWQHQFLNLTTSRTKQFCETSSFFEVDNIKNEAILRDFLQKWKVECWADGLVPMRFVIFRLHLSKLLRLPRKSDARSYEVLHLSRKIISANLKICGSKMQPLSGNQRPDLLTALMNMSYCTCHGKCIFADPLHMSHACYRFWKCYKTLTFCSLLTRCTIPCACHAKRHLNVPKCSEPPQFFPLLTSKCASHHNGVHFFNISTSKSGPELVCFVPFDFEIRFAPQRPALFRHRNFYKCSEHVVLLTFWLRNVLRATTACTLSTSQLPKVVRAWCVLYILTWKCASRHNGVTFRPSGATNHWKNTVFRDFPTFSRTWILFLLRLSLFWSSFFFSALRWLFPSLLFICPYCRKFDF